MAGFIAENIGWPTVFYFLAVLTLVPFILLFFVKEIQREAGERFNWAAFGAFKNRQVLAAAGVGLVIFLVVVGANQIVNPSFSAHMNLSLSMAGLITTVWGIGCVVGGLLGGFIMDRTSDKTAIWISIFTVVPTMVLLAVVTNLPVAFIAAVIFGAAYGISQTVYFALAMKYTDPSIAASMFAILMAVTNVGQGIGLAFSGILAKSAGYPITFLVFGALMFLVIPFMPVLFKKEQAPA